MDAIASVVRCDAVRCVECLLDADVYAWSWSKILEMARVVEIAILLAPCREYCTRINSWHVW